MIRADRGADLCIISIHTPTKGATRLHLCLLLLFQYFNPHSHEGSDLVTDSPPFSCSISIHTPTKGATHFFLQLRQSFSYFNPHSHEGSDASFTIAFSFCVNFNPHSHEGSDRHTLQDDKLRQNFNPHSHEGSDSVASMSFASFPVFQSTLPRRERRFFILHVIVHNNFNPHSHEGSDAVPLENV